MATHGCIRCSKCRGACPICGTCACKKEAEARLSFSARSIAEEIDREILAELYAMPDKNDEQKPETD